MFEGIRVLLVEDDASVRDSTAAQLRLLGCQVTAVASSWDGLKALSTSDPFDLLLTDIGLPGGPNGIELASRAQRAFPSDLRILLTTGAGYDPQEEAANSGFSVLRKPYGLTELGQVLQRELAERSQLTRS